MTATTGGDPGEAHRAWPLWAGDAHVRGPSMSDNSYGWIWLRDLVIEHASVGHDPGERRQTQPVHIDIGVWVNTAQAAATDDVEDTLHWLHLAHLVEKVTLRRHYALIETLCESLATAVMEQFKLHKVRLEVRKPRALPCGMASVAIERTQDSPRGPC